MSKENFQNQDLDSLGKFAWAVALELDELVASKTVTDASAGRLSSLFLPSQAKSVMAAGFYVPLSTQIAMLPKIPAAHQAVEILANVVLETGLKFVFRETGSNDILFGGPIGGAVKRISWEEHCYNLRCPIPLHVGVEAKSLEQELAYACGGTGPCIRVIHDTVRAPAWMADQCPVLREYNVSTDTLEFQPVCVLVRIEVALEPAPAAPVVQPTQS
jgi:hypothetical protein